MEDELLAVAKLLAEEEEWEEDEMRSPLLKAAKMVAFTEETTGDFALSPPAPPAPDVSVEDEDYLVVDWNPASVSGGDEKDPRASYLVDLASNSISNAVSGMCQLFAALLPHSSSVQAPAPSTPARAAKRQAATVVADSSALGSCPGPADAAKLMLSPSNVADDMMSHFSPEKEHWGKQEAMPRMSLASLDGHA